jgi:hypothetical protein
MNFKSKFNNPSTVVERILTYQTNQSIIKWDLGDDGILGIIHLNDLRQRIISSNLHNISSGQQRQFIESLILPEIEQYLIDNNIQEVLPLNHDMIRTKWCVYNLPPCFDIDLNNLNNNIITQINNEFNLINGNLKVCYLTHVDKINDEYNKHLNDMNQLRRKFTKQNILNLQSSITNHLRDLYYQRFILS